MNKSDHLLKLYDKKGTLLSVMISAELWTKGGARLADYLDSLLGVPTTPPGMDKDTALATWKEFCSYWDFKYPYEASVECKGCGAKVADWTTDTQNTFALKSAQVGGLAVFTCTACGGTVRKKHFKDHVCFEFSPKLR